MVYGLEERREGATSQSAGQKYAINADDGLRVCVILLFGELNKIKIK